MWIHELKRNKMTLVSFTDTNIEIHKTVILQHVLYGCEKWELALKGEDNLLIKIKCE
jgi:hypothetical protein